MDFDANEDAMRYTVAQDDWLDCVITFDGMGRFYVWTHVAGKDYRLVDEFAFDWVDTLAEAKDQAQRYLDKQYDDMALYFGEK